MLPARRALIVGNSDGIGLALTRRLLADGWTVAGLSRRPSPVQAAGYRHAVADVTAADYRAALQRLQASEAPFAASRSRTCDSDSSTPRWRSTLCALS